MALASGSGQHAPTNSEEKPFPAVFFLDHRVFQQLRIDLPKATEDFDPTLKDWLGDINILATAYWHAVHWYIPVVSRVTFGNQLLDPLQRKKVDVLLLLTSMKLLLWQPGTEPFPREMYLRARKSLQAAEDTGLICVRLLQARVVLLIFEYGHALFPAAYFSVATCARLGAALGVNKTLRTKELFSTPLETEEARRTWWMILLVDRLVAEVA